MQAGDQPLRLRGDKSSQAGTSQARQGQARLARPGQVSCCGSISRPAVPRRSSWSVILAAWRGNKEPKLGSSAAQQSGLQVFMSTHTLQRASKFPLIRIAARVESIHKYQYGRQYIAFQVWWAVQLKMVNLTIDKNLPFELLIYMNGPSRHFICHFMCGGGQLTEHLEISKANYTNLKPWILYNYYKH